MEGVKGGKRKKEEDTKEADKELSPEDVLKLGNKIRR